MCTKHVKGGLIEGQSCHVTSERTEFTNYQYGELRFNIMVLADALPGPAD
jgi:hypothetical protein